MKAANIASKPVVAISHYMDVEAAVTLINDYNIRRVVIIDDKDKLVGIFTSDDICRNLRRLSEEIAVKLISFPTRKRVYPFF
jgi:predicted transcriptional regulator